MTRWIQAAWAVAITADVLLLLLGSALTAFCLTIGLAALWCRTIDREEHAVQLIGSSDSDALNLYPTHGSVSR